MAEVFGRTAETYDQVLPFCAEFAADLLAAADPRPGESALDVACGRGAVTAPLAEAVAPGRVTAVDLSPGMVSQLEADLSAAGITNVDARVGDAEHLDLEPESFDLVTCGYGLQYLYTPALFVDAAARALRRGGRLVVSIPLQMTAGWDVYNQLIPKYVPKLVEPVQPGPPRPDVPLLFTNAGLSPESSTTTRSFTLYDPEQWWAWTLSHGHRLFLDGLSSEDREAFKAEATALMEPKRGPNGYEMTWTTQITVGTAP